MSRSIYYLNYENASIKQINSFSKVNVSKEFLTADLELYDWKKLDIKYKLNSKSQFEFLIKFIEKYEFEKIDELQGAYAIAYSKNGKIILIRDIVGIKPLCYSTLLGKLQFDSELKKLSESSVELNPRTYLTCENNKFKIIERSYYKSTPIINEEMNKGEDYNLDQSKISEYGPRVENKDYLNVKENVFDLFVEAVKKRIENSKKIGVLFSGGTDSTLMSFILQKLNVEFTCYTASIKSGNITEGEDIYYARKISKECNFNWKLVELEEENVEEYTRNVIKIIDNSGYVKVSVAVPLFIALEQAKKDGIDFVFTGIGSEEIFADYKRFVDVKDINETCIEGLKSLWVRDLYRDNTLATYNNIELKFPFLDDEFVDYVIRIKPEFKIDKINSVNKIILRDILTNLGLSKAMVCRTKKAAQYGSRSDRVYEKLAKKMRMKKQEYLDSLI